MNAGRPRSPFRSTARRYPQASYPDGTTVMVGDLARWSAPDAPGETLDGVVSTVSARLVVLNGRHKVQAEHLELIERLHDLEGRPMSGPPAAAEIARALAESEPFMTIGGRIVCVWCDEADPPIGRGVTPHGVHDDACLWLQARRWRDGEH